MNYTAELYPALTMEECAKRVSDAVLHGGFGSGTEVDRYTVETAEGPVCILLLYVHTKYAAAVRGAGYGDGAAPAPSERQG